ncbi:hypothetical protein Ancab_016701 [Ancistrocladus abbreviatus]
MRNLINRGPDYFLSDGKLCKRHEKFDKPRATECWSLESGLSALGSKEDSHPSRTLHNHLLGSCTEVSRMLAGGVKVVGIYVWVGDSTFKNSTLTLCQAVKGVAGAAPLSDTDWDERLLIHICYSPRRLPVYDANVMNMKTLNDILQNAISIHAEELKGAKAIIDGNPARSSAA